MKPNNYFHNFVTVVGVKNDSFKEFYEVERVYFKAFSNIKLGR